MQPESCFVKVLRQISFVRASPDSRLLNRAHCRGLVAWFCSVLTRCQTVPTFVQPAQLPTLRNYGGDILFPKAGAEVKEFTAESFMCSKLQVCTCGRLKRF